MSDFPIVGGDVYEQLQNPLQTHNTQPSMGGGRRRRGSRRSRRGRKGRGGYLTEVLSSAALLGATQFAKGRANYGSRKRRSSRRSRRSSRRR